MAGKEKGERPIITVRDGKIVNTGKIKLPDGTHRVLPETGLRHVNKNKGGKVSSKKMMGGGAAKKARRMRGGGGVAPKKMRGGGAAKAVSPRKAMAMGIMRGGKVKK